MSRTSDPDVLPLFDEAFLRRLERLSFRTAPWLRGARWGERRSRQLRPAFDFSDHRPYSTGDDLRHVDWKVYGRHGELFVKLGEATQSVNVHILLDCSPSMAWDPGHNLRAARSVKWDATRRLAGTLGYLGLVGGERLTLQPFVSPAPLGERFGPARGKHQVVQLLQFLSALPPAAPLGRRTPRASLAETLAAYARSHPGGGLLVLVSDLFDWADPLLYDPTGHGAGEAGQMAAGLRCFPPPRWQVLVLHLLSRHEIQPELTGDMDLQDSETGERLPFHIDERTLTQYQRRVRRWCDGLQAVSARWGARYSRVLAEWPLEQAVVPYLQQRGVIQ